MVSEQKKSSLEWEKIGLCSNCKFQRRQTAKGDRVYSRCARADQDEAFDRYPALPVRECRGHEPDTKHDHDFGIE